MKKYEMSPTEENLIETLYKDTIDRNKDIVYFYNILQAQDKVYPMSRTFSFLFSKNLDTEF